MICERVSAKMMLAFPELAATLQLESAPSLEQRLSKVATERFCEMLRAILVFEAFELADQELRWAHPIIVRQGVTYQHQATMVRWVFEEVRRLPLDAAEKNLVYELEQYLNNLVRTIFQPAGS